MAPKKAGPALAMSEKDLQAGVMTLAKLYGWTTNHVRRTIGGSKQGWVTSTTLVGWPDLTLIRPPRLLFVELKGPTGKLTAEQEEVLHLLSLCPGVETYAWWPEDLQLAADILNPKYRPPTDLTRISRSPA